VPSFEQFKAIKDKLIKKEGQTLTPLAKKEAEEKTLQ
jgi:hypothetical protein